MILGVDEVKQALVAHFQQNKDPDKVWHAIQGFNSKQYGNC